MIIGTGIDIVEVERIRNAIERHGDRFLNRIFLDVEIAYCKSNQNPYQRFATRFAAKEAVLKALRVGWQKGTSFTDIRITKDDSGAPSVELNGRSLEISKQLGVRNIHISLSHISTYAVAYAVAES